MDEKKRKIWRTSGKERMRGCTGVGKEYLSISLSQEVFCKAVSPETQHLKADFTDGHTGTHRNEIYYPPFFSK